MNIFYIHAYLSADVIFILNNLYLRNKELQIYICPSFLKYVKEHINEFKQERDIIYHFKDVKALISINLMLKSWYKKVLIFDGLSVLITVSSFVYFQKTVLSLEDLKGELEKYGYKYKIETFQKEPYIMMMKISDTNVTMMGRGGNKQEALNDLFENIVLMFNHGFSLKTDF